MFWIESYSSPASGTEYPDIFLAEKYSVLWTSLYHWFTRGGDVLQLCCRDRNEEKTLYLDTTRINDETLLLCAAFI